MLFGRPEQAKSRDDALAREPGVQSRVQYSLESIQYGTGKLSL
jgi:hypothetical protein